MNYFDFSAPSYQGLINENYPHMYATNFNTQIVSSRNRAMHSWRAIDFFENHQDISALKQQTTLYISFDHTFHSSPISQHFLEKFESYEQR